MKRETKFRAFQDNQMLTSPINSNYGLTRFFGFLYEDAPIMQYTGVKDNNGIEIYEGDLCRCTHYNHSHPDTVLIQEVMFEKGTFILKSKDADSLEPIQETVRCVPLFYFCNPTPNKIEVIGNIYENPELLQ